MKRKYVTPKVSEVPLFTHLAMPRGDQWKARWWAEILPLIRVLRRIGAIH